MSQVNSLSLNSFNANHELYDRVRPDFDNRAVDILICELGLKEGSKLLELAVGTGKFTKAIVGKGFDILAVEPSTGMLTSFQKNFPDILALEGSSYSLPVEDNSQDGIIVAQGFHWFADVASLKELARVLKPGCKLGLIWNFEDIDDLPEGHWQRSVCEYMWSFTERVPQFHQQTWRNVFDEQQPYFKVPIGEERLHFKREYPINKELLWCSWKSRSYVTAMSPEKQEEVRAQVIKRFEEGVKPEDEVRDGKIQVHMGVHVVWTEVNK